MRVAAFTTALLCHFFAAIPVLAKPVVLAVQGALRTVSGGAVADGDYPLGVAFYPDSSGGTPLYVEKFLGVAVKGGFFALDVGSADPTKVLDDALFGTAPGKPQGLWIGVQVGSEPELQRVQARPVVLAIHARAADKAYALECSGCIDTGAVKEGAITGDKIAAGSIEAKHVNFSYASSKSKGGPAESAEFANAAKIAEVAKNAEAAAVADEAKSANKLACTGCVTVEHLAGNVVADLIAKKQLAAVAASGKFGDLTGGPDLSGYGALDKSNKWKEAQDFQEQEALLFRFQNAGKDPVPCTDKNVGLSYYNTADQTLRVCNGKEFMSFAQTVPLGSKDNPAASCAAVLKAIPASKSGIFWLKPKGAPFQAYCDMTNGGGGWTMALNLDTSDGHVSWWADPIWTDGKDFGDVTTPYDGDHKSLAFMDLEGTSEVMIAVHEQGKWKGWRSWTKADGKSLHTLIAGSGDNTVLGKAVSGGDISQIPGVERLVRTSTVLYANHCVQTGGGCVQAGGGSPDGDRIASHESAPSDNVGGGLGNWHDMGYCCGGKSYAGQGCNGIAFRTTSEAQTGWAACYGGNPAGFFGSDTFGPATNSCTDSTGCQFSNWSQQAGVNFDYAVFLR
jgi:hypothetical protein